VANGVTVATGNNTSPPNATKFQTKEASGLHVPAVVIGYSDGSDAFVTSDASGLAVQGTTTLDGVSASSATVTSVADNAASTQLLAANANRIGWAITNTSSAVLYLKFGSGATTTTSYTKRLVQYADAGQGPIGLYTGAIYGIWASDPGDGAANCTEW
jgi:hypothetical protein